MAVEWQAKRASHASRRSGRYGVGRRQRLADSTNVALPGADFGAQLGATGARELVILCAPVVVGVSPVAGEPPVLLEAVERGVERPLLHEQVAIGHALDPLGNGVPMPGPPGEGLED